MRADFAHADFSAAILHGPFVLKKRHPLQYLMKNVSLRCKILWVGGGTIPARSGSARQNFDHEI
jgi:hypothetical protein